MIRDLGLAQVRGGRGDAKRARERELAAAAPRLAVDRRNHRLRQRLDASQRPAPAARVARHRLTPPDPCEVLEVGVGHEVAGNAAGEHDHAHVVTIREVVEPVAELAHGLEAHEVARRSREGEERDGPPSFDLPVRHPASRA